MTRWTRRDFIAGSAAAVAGAAALRGMTPAQTSEVVPIRVRSGTDVVRLGSTGIETSVLGIGSGTRGGREQRELGPEGVVRLVREAFDLGVRYIDTADNYKIHTLLAPAIKELPRDKLFLQTKTPAKNAEKARDDIERYRRELGVETLDTVLMHCMRTKGWPQDMRPVRDVLLDAKRKGQVRAVGVSCHGWDPLVDSVDCPDLDCHLVRINHAGKVMDAEPEKVAEQMKKMFQKGRGIIGMKIYGEGAFKTREERLASLKFVLGLGCVHCFTIGFSSAQQIKETLDLIKEATA